MSQRPVEEPGFDLLIIRIQQSYPDLSDFFDVPDLQAGTKPSLGKKLIGQAGTEITSAQDLSRMKDESHQKIARAG